MNDSRLDKVIADTAYTLDCLIALRNIYETGKDCNTCHIKMTCKYAPELGQQVRYNCPLWEGET